MRSRRRLEITRSWRSKWRHPARRLLTRVDKAGKSGVVEDRETCPIFDLQRPLDLMAAGSAGMNAVIDMDTVISPRPNSARSATPRARSGDWEPRVPHTANDPEQLFVLPTCRAVRLELLRQRYSSWRGAVSAATFPLPHELASSTPRHL